MKKWQKNIPQASLFLWSLGLPGLLHAQEKQETLSETTSLLFAIFKIVGSLAIVVALMVAFVYLLKKTGINRSLGDHSLIKVLDNKMIAPKKYIAIVEIAGKTLSLGITDQNISMLTELDPSAVSCLKKTSGASSAEGFPQQFAGFLARAAKKRSVGEGKDDK